MPEVLTPREREVALLMGVECLTSKQIGRRLGISFRTVECHRYQVLAKLGCRNTVMLARRLALDEIH